MKFLKQTITAALMLCVLAAGALASEPQKNDQKKLPPKDPKTIENPKKQPPPREPKNDNRGNENRRPRP